MLTGGDKCINYTLSDGGICMTHILCGNIVFSFSFFLMSKKIIKYIINLLSSTNSALRLESEEKKKQKDGGGNFKFDIAMASDDSPSL